MLSSQYQQPLEIAQYIASRIRTAVHDHLDKPEAGDAAGVAASGDTTFSIDIIAEEALNSAVSEHGARLACYSEDEGLKELTPDPEWLLIVDPIDGTRPAAAGLDACAVSVAVTRMSADARMKDVVAGAVYELRRDRLYLAARDSDAVRIENGVTNVISPRPPSQFCELRWTLETVARPAKENFLAARYLIDETSLRGGLFCLSSSAFSLCQVASGKFSGKVDLSGRLLKELDLTHEKVKIVGHGRVMGLWAYDIAAAALIAERAGCTITDAWGNPLDEVRLTRTEPEDMGSCICAASREYHDRMLELLNRGFAELR